MGRRLGGRRRVASWVEVSQTEASPNGAKDEALRTEVSPVS